MHHKLLPAMKFFWNEQEIIKVLPHSACQRDLLSDTMYYDWWHACFLLMKINNCGGLLREWCVLAGFTDHYLLPLSGLFYRKNCTIQFPQNLVLLSASCPARGSGPLVNSVWQQHRKVFAAVCVGVCSLSSAALVNSTAVQPLPGREICLLCLENTLLQS